MGVFTDESHTEYVQADPSKPPIKPRGNACERELLTEKNIRYDINDRLWPEILRVIILGMFTVCAVIPLVWLLVKKPWHELFILYGAGCLMMMIITVLFLICRVLRYSTHGKTLTVHKGIVTFFGYFPYSRHVQGMLSVQNFPSINMPDKMYFLWSKTYRSTLKQTVEHIHIGDEVYVVMMNGTRAVAAYPCDWFLWEKEHCEQ